MTLYGNCQLNCVGGLQSVLRSQVSRLLRCVDTYCYHMEVGTLEENRSIFSAIPSTCLSTGRVNTSVMVKIDVTSSNRAASALCTISLTGEAKSG